MLGTVCFRLNGSTVDGTTINFPGFELFNYHGSVHWQCGGEPDWKRSSNMSDPQYHFDGGYAELLVYDIPLSRIKKLRRWRDIWHISGA